MDPDRPLTLSDAAALAGCSRKALERRVERGSMPTQRGDDGQRLVCVGDLMRAGLVTVAPTCGVTAHDPTRRVEAESEAHALRAALSATEVALCRARDATQTARAAARDAEQRAADAEQDLNRMVMGVATTPVYRLAG